MGITGSIIVYDCIWWIIFFISLPFGIISEKRKYRESLKGNDPGAPKNPNILKKFIISTLITSILFFGIYYMVSNNYLNLREYLK